MHREAYDDATLDDDVRAQLARYVHEWRDASAGQTTSEAALGATLNQLRAYADDLRKCMVARDAASAALERVCTGMLSWLVTAADLRDGESADHSRRVARFTRILAETSGMPEARARQLEVAARYHDVGRIAWSDELAIEIDPLSVEQRDAVTRHCDAGDALAGTGSELLQTVVRVIQHHHECWDGSGYPRALAGEAIPLDARIVQLADVYDTLRSARRYKPAQSHVAASKSILQGGHCTSPAQFAPELLDVFGQAERQLEQAARTGASTTE
jgi:response regulator RpfG family c-di-GMP phosphodiesterase